MSPRVRAQAVQERALAEGMGFVPGEHFYVDRGGTHELRLCYTSQPPERAVSAARCLARGIADAAKHAPAEPTLVQMA